MAIRYMQPAMAHMAQALERFSAAGEPTQTGASLSFQKDKSQPHLDITHQEGSKLSFIHAEGEG